MQQAKTSQRKFNPWAIYGVGLVVLIGIFLLARQLQQMPLANISPVIAMGQALSQNTQQGAAQPGAQLFIPLVQGLAPGETGAGLQQTPAQAEDAADVAEEWVRYVFEDGGFAIRIPASWRVQPFAVWGFEVIPPSDDPRLKTAVWYLNHEKPESADLEMWLRAYYAREIGGEPNKAERIYSPVNLNIQGTRAESHQLIGRSPGPALDGHTYYISHGRLVLTMTPGRGAEGQGDLLRAIAESVEFLPDVPLDFVELYHPDPPPAWLTLEEAAQGLQDYRDAYRAFSIRLETGETPTELLETFTEQARALYEEILVRAADRVEAADRQREEEAAMPPPDPSEMDYSGYWEGERMYCEWLQEQEDLDYSEEMREYCEWLQEQ